MHPPPTQQCSQRPHVLLHQQVHLLFGEAADAVAVHLPAYHAAVQVAQQPLQRVAEGAAHRQKLLGFLQVVHPLTVGDRPAKHTKRATSRQNPGNALESGSRPVTGHSMPRGCSLKCQSVNVHKEKLSQALGLQQKQVKGETVSLHI